MNDTETLAGEMLDTPLERDEIVLTVSEGKRMIGLAVAALPIVQHALRYGVVGISRGTTNGYVAEAIMNRELDRAAFTTGLTLPVGCSPKSLRGDRELGEIVIEKGVVVAGKSLAEAARTMGPEDVLIKGANALNYREQIAGILIGHPTGGTIGGIIGPIMGRRITLVIPVGLEKQVAFPIDDASRALAGYKKPGLSLWPVSGQIITEIEALAILTGIDAMQIAAGGVAGAEGSIRLLLEGTAEQMAAVHTLLEGIRPEPSFEEVAMEQMEARRGR